MIWCGPCCAGAARGSGSTTHAASWLEPAGDRTSSSRMRRTATAPPARPALGREPIRPGATVQAPLRPHSARLSARSAGGAGPAAPEAGYAGGAGGPGPGFRAPGASHASVQAPRRGDAGPVSPQPCDTALAAARAARRNFVRIRGRRKGPTFLPCPLNLPRSTSPVPAARWTRRSWPSSSMRWTRSTPSPEQLPASSGASRPTKVIPSACRPTPTRSSSSTFRSGR